MRTKAEKAGRKRNRRRREAKARILKARWLKDNGPCKCGSTERLEIDHITPLRKRHDNLKIFLKSPENQLILLQDCQVLCRPCHLQKCILETRKYEHGRNLYERHGCRCSICRSAISEARRLYRQRQHVKGVPWSQIS